MLELKKSKDCNIPCTVRFQENLFNDLKSISKKNNISFNNLIIQLCDYGVSELKDSKK